MIQNLKPIEEIIPLLQNIILADKLQYPFPIGKSVEE